MEIIFEIKINKGNLKVVFFPSNVKANVYNQNQSLFLRLNKYFPLPDGNANLESTCNTQFICNGT